MESLAKDRTGKTSVVQIAPALGARIENFDLRHCSDVELALLKSELLRHCVLIIPKQFLDADDHVALSKRLGEPLIYPNVDFGNRGLPSGVLRLLNEGKEKVITEHWHFDGPYLETPPSICILAAQEIPACGGDTMWTNQYLAYDSLSAGMKSVLESLRCNYVSTRIPKLYANNENRRVAASQPAVRVHPETGRRSLYIGSPEVCRNFEGMTEAESRPLIEYLFSVGQRPDFGFRHVWSPGDVVIWDNRCTMHYAVHDYGTAPRIMHRVALRGERPISPYPA